MTAHFTGFSMGRSAQARVVDPDAPGAEHPRCLEMAEAMREGADTFKLLVRGGFTAAEIAEYAVEAGRIAAERAVRHVRPRPDAMEDVVCKAREAVPSRPPLPRGIEETQAVLVAWARYCQARNALMLYAWAPLREHCLTLLDAYLDRSDMFAPSRRAVVQAVADSPPKVTQ
jgi:hypothetical protein